MPTDPVELLKLLIPTEAGGVPRPLEEWAGDYALNVKDFGAVGNGSANDNGSIQACFDAAFKTGGTPHGVNSHLNRPVYFPPGHYMCGDLTLTQVKGGLIYGAGAGTTLHYNGTPGANKAIIKTDGFESSRVQGFGFIAGGATVNCIGLDLDVLSSSSPVGLRNNIIQEVGGSGIGIGIRIGEAGNQGYGHYILQCIWDNCTRAIKIKSTGTNTLVNFGTAECNAGNMTGYFFGVPPSGPHGYGVECTAGDVIQFNLGGAGNQTDVLWSSTGTFIVIGARSESLGVLEITNGRAILLGAGFDADETDQPPGGSDWIPLGWMRLVKMASPAIVTVDGCNAAPAGVIEGTGTLYIRGGSSFGDSRYLTNFTGQVRELGLSAPITMSQLTFNAAEGCEVTVSNCNAPAGSWGNTVTSGSTGSNHAKLRWNGSAWTIVGR